MALQLLKNVSFFKQLPSAELTRILRISKSQSFAAGELIISRQDSGRHFFIVLSGHVKIFIASAARKRKTFAMLQKGAFFGEMSLLDGKVRSASAQAMEPTTLLLIRKRDFKRLLFKDPRLMYKILKTLSDRLRVANEEVEALLFKNLMGRTVHTLLELLDRKNKIAQSAFIPMKLTHQDLADLVGTTREPMTRAVSMLRKIGVLEYRNKTIHLKDISRLKALA